MINVAKTGNITRLISVYWSLLCIVERLSSVSPSTAASQVYTFESSSLKSVNGNKVCAVDAASRSSSARSKLDCVRQCVSSSVWPCTGVNFRNNAKLCELFVKLSVNYTAQEDCEHLQIPFIPTCPIDSSAPVICMLIRDEFLTPVRSLSSWVIVHELHNKTYSWNRPWNDYKTGFGQLGSDYWFGLEKLHQLTAAAVSYKLRMEARLMPLSTILSIEMAVFSIGDEASHYQLTWSGMTSSDMSKIGTLPYDPQSYHNGKSFSTYDNNRAFDMSNHRSCPELQGGGWWYNGCYAFCLTCVGNLGYCLSGGSSFNIADGTLCADFTRMMIATA